MQSDEREQDWQAFDAAPSHFQVQVQVGSFSFPFLGVVFTFQPITASRIRPESELVIP